MLVAYLHFLTLVPERKLMIVSIVISLLNAIAIFLRVQAHHIGVNMPPWWWWLHTGLITSYLGQWGWRGLEKNFNAWECLVVDTAIHTGVWVVGTALLTKNQTEVKYLIAMALLATSLVVALWPTKN